MEWYEMVLRLLCATVIGVVIGFEREHSGHPAGLKTNSMVCIGAAVIALIEVQMSSHYPGMDPSRIIAQVVSGIGFIGAGCILHGAGKNHAITGLTTASTLWVAACLGIAAGLGYYLMCGIGLAMVMLVLTVIKLLVKAKKKKAKGEEIESDYIE